MWTTCFKDINYDRIVYIQWPQGPGDLRKENRSTMPKGSENPPKGGFVILNLAGDV